MTAPDTGHTGHPQAKSAVTIRAVSWALLAMLLAFLTNNVLNLSFQSDTELRWNNPLPMLVYLIPMLAAVLFARGTPGTALRQDADRIHRLNLYLVRSLFWGVFLVGMADVAVAFLRVEGLAESLLWEGAANDLNKLNRRIGKPCKQSREKTSLRCAPYCARRNTLGNAFSALQRRFFL